MIEVDIETSEWCKIYNLEVEKEKCLNCNKILTTNIPIALKDYRGLKSETHKCGPKYDHLILRRK